MKFLHKYIYFFFFHILEISQNDNAVAFNYSILFSIPMTCKNKNINQNLMCDLLFNTLIM